MLSPKALSERFPLLTVRESEILAYVANGNANADICAPLAIAEKTVKNALLSIPGKVGLAESRGGSIRVRLALIAHGIAID